MTATKQQPVAEICSASHDNAEFGERAIKPLCDISGFEYGTPLYAGAAPAAVAGPAWDKTRDSLATLLLGLARRPFLDFDVACIALDAATEPGMPLAYMRGAPAAPALEAPAAPTLVGDEQADAYLTDPGRLESLARSHPAGLVRALARAALAAAPQASAAPSAEGLREQHDRDSAELRRLCQARDEARRERDLARAENAGLQASTGHLSALVDGQHALLEKAKATMTALHGSASPIDESGGDFDARIPASAFARFVDAHAELLHAMAQSPVAAPAAPAVDASTVADMARALEMLVGSDALHSLCEHEGIDAIGRVKGTWSKAAECNARSTLLIHRKAIDAAIAAQAKEGGA